MNFLEWLQFIVLGIIQGVTEPIPVSSSGHLLVVQELFNMDIEPLKFAVWLNFASLLAVMLVYRKELVSLTVHFFSYLRTKDNTYKQDYYFVWYLVAATLPAGVVGVLFGDAIETWLDGIKIIGGTLIITAIALYAIRNMQGNKSDQQLTLKDAMIIGFAQMLALIPGISRSGATLVAGMALGLKQETAFRFSFLLYIPVSLGSGILTLGDLINDPDIVALWPQYLSSFFLCFITTYFSLKWFMGIMKKGKLIYFSIYCVLAGVSILIFL